MDELLLDDDFANQLSDNDIKDIAIRCLLEHLTPHEVAIAVGSPLRVSTIAEEMKTEDTRIGDLSAYLEKHFLRNGKRTLNIESELTTIEASESLKQTNAALTAEKTDDEAERFKELMRTQAVAADFGLPPEKISVPFTRDEWEAMSKADKLKWLKDNNNV